MKKHPIILTRPVYEADNIKQSLMSQGFDVVSFPMIEIQALPLNEADKLILKQIADFKQIVFTSKNGVQHFFEQLASKEDLQNTRFACIGKTTALALEMQGFTAEIIGEKTSVEFMPIMQKEFAKADEKLLLVQGKLADDNLLNGLQSVCPATRFDVYDTVPVKNYAKETVERICQNDYELLLFTSPSAYKRFFEIMNENQLSAPFRIACIGNITAAAVRESGIEPVFVASKTKGEEMVKELIKFIKK